MGREQQPVGNKLPEFNAPQSGARRASGGEQLSPLILLNQINAIGPLQGYRRHFLGNLIKGLTHEQAGREPALRDGDSILDIGSGVGTLGDVMQSQLPHSRIVSTDIEDRHQGETQFVLAHGDELPFPDNSFDAITIFYVLHHVPDPKAVLKEAMRVSKGKIIVEEDTYTNPVQKLAYNIHVNSYRIGLREATATPVRTDTEWQQVFEDVGLTIATQKHIRKLGYPVSRQQYILVPTAPTR